MNPKEIKEIIKQCAENPSVILTLNEPNKITAETCANLQSRNSDLKNFIDANKDDIQIAVQDAYKEGIDCTSFQQQVIRTFKAEDPSATPPNFISKITSYWMENLDKETKNKPLNELLLPGTHDSGANRVDFSKTPAFLNWQQRISYKLLSFPVINTIARGFIENWTVTQNASIGEQLENGVRLLDLRLGKADTGDLHLAHTFLLDSFENSLKEIEKFIDNYPGEVVVINLDKDFPYELSNDDKVKAANLIKEILGNGRILGITEPLGSLNELTTKGKKIVLYGGNGIVPEGNDLFRINKSDEIWPGKSTPQEAVAELVQQFAIPRTEEMVYASLNTTPDEKTIALRALRPHLNSNIFELENLVGRGQEIQERYLNTVLEARKSAASKPGHTNIAGITFDAPTVRSIQTIIKQN